MSIIEEMNKGIEKNEREHRDFLAEMKEREDARIRERGGRPKPLKDPGFYGFRRASYKDYGDWIIGFLLGGGEITHHYDYDLPDEFFIATKDFDLPEFCGAESVSIVIPLKVQTGRPKGHNSYYFRNDFSHYGIVPMYNDVKKYIIPRVKKEEKKIRAGQLSIVKTRGGGLSKVDPNGEEV